MCEVGDLTWLIERCLKAQQTSKLSLMLIAGGDALLEEAGELLVELLVGLGVVFGLFFEELEITLGNQAVELLDQRAVLHGFTGDIEW